MSVESRIREGLRANTQHLQPALEHGEEVVMRKVEQRRRDRRVKYAGAGALVAAAAAVGVVWLPSASKSDDRSDQPADQEDRSAAIPLPMEGELVPGTYEARFAGGGPRTPRALVDVPEGFEAWDRWAVLRDDHGIGFWTVAKVKKDPCEVGTFGEDPGPLVSDVAAALQAQKRTRATQPVPVSLGGYDGLFLELTTPGPEASCMIGRYDLWTDPSGGARYVEPGEVVSLWILDVHGTRLIVNASGSDDGTEVGRRVREMVQSVEIVEPEP